MKKFLIATILFFTAVAAQAFGVAPVAATDDSLQGVEAANDKAIEKERGEINPKEIIFDHLLDRYGWEVPFNHHKNIPLPVIVFGSDGFHCFSSNRIAHGKTWRDGNAEFRIAGADSPYKGKVVEIVDGKEVRPWDISITKNVCALFIAAILLVVTVLAVARWHRTKTDRAPRGFLGALEALVSFVYDGVIVPSLKEKSPKYANFLLTVFFFILYMNLLGLIVIFPGGANLTGNISVTLVLALFTFVITNITGKKHYWKEIFWPDVPWWLKFPIPLMQIIELFGALIKPATLTIRLFANMLSGHLVVLVLTLLIILFGAFGASVAGATAVVSVLFSLFMLLLDVLVSFIQAYVFTMLSSIFIAMSNEEGEHHAHDKEAEKEVGHATVK